MPKGFPYFAVDFGNEGGFAHVIEDEQKFPHYFGKVSIEKDKKRILFVTASVAIYTLHPFQC